MSDKINFWEYMRMADQTNEVLSAIPTASLSTITQTATGEIKNPRNIMAVVVDGRIVATVSKRYRLVQHKDAFSPIFQGLHNTATPYKFSLFETDTKAYLNVYADEVMENGEKILLGFRAVNSIDGDTALNYRIRSSIKSTTIELVGYRLACSNGMKIRVPLDKAEEIRLEKVERVKELISMATRILHVGTEEAMKHKIEAVQYVVEALAILKEPIALIIKKAQNIQVGEEQAKLLLQKYCGKRLQQRILDRFKSEEGSLFGLVNAVTFTASHNATIPQMNGLINSSAIMLEEEIFQKRD